jgi:hypothetical protein
VKKEGLMQVQTQEPHNKRFTKQLPTLVRIAAIPNAVPVNENVLAKSLPLPKVFRCAQPFAV